MMLARAKSALFITGAGLSVESGAPTYRGIGGLYRNKATENGVSLEIALSSEMLQRRPKLTWRYLLGIEEQSRACKPNAAHTILTSLEQRLPRSLILTQNIDGLHRQAGAERVVEIHGNLRELRCVRCDFRSVLRDFIGLPTPPACPQCQGLLRPDIVMFGESLPHAPFIKLQSELERGFDLVVVIGTTAMFPYIARPVLVAKSEGISTVEINPTQTDLSDVVDMKLRAQPAYALSKIWAAYESMTR